MKLSEISWLAVENIPVSLTSYLQGRGWKIQSVFDLHLHTKSDIEILSYAYAHNLGILTQDSDFGELIFKQKQPFCYLCRIWPGHINPDILVRAFDKVSSAKTQILPQSLITINIKLGGGEVVLKVRTH